MKQRLQLILRHLSHHREYVTIEELAQITNSGARTIHRDLEYLTRTLGFRGVRLERRRGYGVRLLDRLPGSLLKELEQFIPEVTNDPSQRPILLLLYLLLSEDWIKLGELAQVFFISDSSVSTDLSSLETHLPPGVSIERQKGVGVRVIVDPLTSRLLILQFISAVVPPQVFISQTQPEHLNIDWLYEILDVSNQLPPLKVILQELQHHIGLDVSPKFLSILLAYGLIMKLDVRRNQILQQLPQFSLGVPQIFLDAAHQVFQRLQLVEVSHAEVVLFARLLGACETAMPPTSLIETITDELQVPVQQIIERTLTQLEEQEKIWLHDDPALLDYLSVIIAAALRRIDLYHTPDLLTNREFLGKTTETDHRPASLLCQEFNQVGTNLLGIETFRLGCIDELQEAILVLDARLEAMKSRRVPEYRVRILCYEGLGMSVYLKTLAQDVMPSNTSFDYQWDPDFTQNPDVVSQFDFVISTYGMAKLPIPQVIVGEDWTPETIRGAIKDCLNQLGQPSDKNSTTAETSVEPLRSTKKNLGISLSAIMEVTQHFFVATRNEQELIAQAVNLLETPDCDRSLIKEDMHRREEYGSLVFEEYGVRVLHCRTQGVSRPRAGVIQPRTTSNSSGSKEDEDPTLTVLVLAAPPDLDSQESRVLSEIVVALSEDPGFFTVLNQGSKDEIQKRIMDYFSQLIEHG